MASRPGTTVVGNRSVPAGRPGEPRQVRPGHRRLNRRLR
jgi:hypothetical protein